MPHFALLDAHSRELWIAMAKNKRSWLALQEGSLVVDLPLSGADASGMIAKLLKQSRGNDERALGALRRMEESGG